MGTGADGIYAENTIGNPIDITVSSGATVRWHFAGVGIGRGGANSLTNRGTIANLNGGNSLAIFGRTGNETVNNFGTVTGNVDLGTGTNAFNKSERRARSIPAPFVGSRGRQSSKQFRARCRRAARATALNQRRFTGNFDQTGAAAFLSICRAPMPTA